MSVFNVSRLGIGVSLPTNATYDHLLVYTPAFPVGAVTFRYGNPTPDKITGIQKCAQNFLKILFTSPGSDLLNPSMGTSISELLVGGGGGLTSSELLSTVTTAVSAAVTQCQTYFNDTKNDPASSLASVTIDSMDTPTVDSFTMGMTLTTMAGETGAIALPTPLLSTTVYNG